MEIICLRELFYDSLFGVVTRGASVPMVLPLKNVVHRSMASVSPESLLVTRNLGPPTRHTKSECLGICGLTASLMILIHTTSSKPLESMQKKKKTNMKQSQFKSKRKGDNFIPLNVSIYLSYEKKTTINLHPSSHN